MNHQSMFDTGYKMLGAGAQGWPREMIWENGIETYKIYVKRIASPGLMYDTGCSGLVHCDDREEWYGKGG